MSCEHCRNGCDYCDGTADSVGSARPATGFMVDERVHAYLSRPPMAVQPVVREYRCTECKRPLEVTNKAPESYADDWQVKPCQVCLDKLEEATKDELNDDWGKVEEGLKADLEARTEELNVSQDKLRDAQNEISALKAERDTACGNLEQAALENESLKEKLHATELLLKDEQQAHIFAKFRADRLSGEW